MRKVMVARVGLVAWSLILFWLAGEVTLRVIYAVDRKRGGDLRERLQRSAREKPRAAEEEFNLGGLVQASRFEDVVYELKPGLSGTYRGKPLCINSAGMRDREYALEKATNVYRIVGLGDSVMFGWGVGEEECYLSLLEERLNALPPPHPVFEVMNFAVPGYNTAMEVAQLAHTAIRYKPDLAILHFVKNDWGIPKFMQNPPEPLSLWRSYFLEFVLTRLGWIQAGEEGLVGYRMKGMDEDKRNDVLDKYRYMVDRSGFRRAMDRLQGIARDDGLSVLILLGSRTAEQESNILQQAAKHGFEVLDIAPVTDRILSEKGFELTPSAIRRALQVAPGDTHPNALGHSIYAQGLMEKLRDMGVVTE